MALVTDLPRTQTFRLFDLFTRVGLHVPVWTGTSLTGISGRPAVDGVLVRGPDGVERAVAVEAVVFSGDFIPDNELARLAGLSIDPGTRGPACEADGRTTAPGIFATGNLVHPAETADVAAHRARTVGRAVAAWLRRRRRAHARTFDGQGAGGGPPALGGAERDRTGPGRDRVRS